MVTAWKQIAGHGDDENGPLFRPIRNNRTGRVDKALDPDMVYKLVKAYSASKLSAFTFITPLFGVLASYFIMHDALTVVFALAALLVIAGLFLVNRP